MARNFNLNMLTENMRKRHVGVEDRRLVEKWAKTGLLRGLEGHKRETMSRLLENQAAELLKEVSDVAGDLRGFQQVAFPIVRRVFGNLVANDLVSVQPMSLPSGLLFYLDYTYGNNVGLSTDPMYDSGRSIYGDGVASATQYGVSGSGGPYDLTGDAFSMFITQSSEISYANIVASGTFGSTLTLTANQSSHTDWGAVDYIWAGDPTFSGSAGSLTNSQQWKWMVVNLSAVSDGTNAVARSNIETVQLHHTDVWETYRHVSKLGTYDSANGFTQDPNGAHLLMLVSGSATWDIEATSKLSASYAYTDILNAGTATADALTTPSWEATTAGGTITIPEIDIKVESVAVVAQSRKLRARWTPELAQDLNAYHNLDAEVELTQILSEQIALEIDNEILGDLISNAATNYFWSRVPGKFVNKATGIEDNAGSFTGATYEWYQTLVETIIDVANTIHRRILRGAANFVVTSPDVCTILESTMTYKPDVSSFTDGAGPDKFGIGAEKVGGLSNRFTVYKDPYFPRAKILVGYKGNSFLETGYVYAPYVPLIVTPTIYQPEDFTPRKGVMTRYGKQLVRADFYGTIQCLDMNIL
jgi:hypothetical protein